MVKIKNRNSKFKILYLPNRTLRFRGSEIKEITTEEFNSEKFKKREKDFIVIKEKAGGKKVKPKQLAVKEEILLEEENKPEKDDILNIK